jgi:2-polyprenyl-3-methyl-5-hydroxy-6-metoxy-1,4-benzoquinol methylase
MQHTAFWDQLHGNNEIERLGPPDALLNQYQTVIPAGNVLDLGAGYGRNGLFFSSKGYPVTISDLSGNALDKGRRLARKLGLEADFVQAAADEDHHFTKDHYSLVICASLLQFFLQEEREVICRKMYDSLQTGGFLYFSSFSTEDDSFKIYKKTASLVETNTVDLQEQMNGGVHYFTEKEVLKMFRKLKLLSVSHRKYYDQGVDSYVGVIHYIGIKTE